ncbi:MAG: hypothetical protein A3F72_14455 [Bacteroidetes bacterium RIFCSPLOWO2_12_FULL_35_15]|nr:MAG: hypothetical protein A3F72_14455 [Bacteroidetes bacterium RIFCSPLOWO2_12_FULL_35_15]
MNIINNIKFRTKIIIMLFLPVVGLIYFSTNSISEKYSDYTQMGNTHDLSVLCKKMGAYVHELQIERGLTGGFVQSKGTEFAQELTTQREQTDKKHKDLKEYISTIDLQKVNKDFTEMVNSVIEKTTKIADKRTAISALEVTTENATAFYTNLNYEFLSVISYVATISSNGKISTLTSAYVNLMQYKERAGQERALLTNVFKEDNITDVQLQKLFNLIASQETYINVFETYASDSQKVFLNNSFKTKEIDEATRMRTLVIEKAKTGKFGIEPTYWFKMQSEKLNTLKVNVVALANDLGNKAEDLESEAKTTLLYFSISTFLIVLLAIIFAFVLSNNLLKQLGGEPSVVVEMATRIADGDLTIEISNKDKHTGLYGAMIKMVEKLKEVIQTVQDSAENISTASGQMTSAAEQMSEGANEQASSAEEVSSSMEQMAANIQQNTDNSKQTEKIAEKAAQDIGEANGAVAKTVGSMKTIAGKISIIGEIARQTNLLALNAAVEAARAGEHGRGFAVVAVEVRKLAERSQAAASEIDVLSSSSMDVANRSGKLLEELVPDIRKTSELVQEISAASVEQNSGADQVNSAIQQLNVVVQQNAASAEELAAGSEELNSQAIQLKEAIAYFKLTEDKSKKQMEQKKQIEKFEKKGKTEKVKIDSYKTIVSMNHENQSNGKKGADINLKNTDESFHSDTIDKGYEKF